MDNYNQIAGLESDQNGLYFRDSELGVQYMVGLTDNQIIDTGNLYNTQNADGIDYQTLMQFNENTNEPIVGVTVDGVGCNLLGDTCEYGMLVPQSTAVTGAALLYPFQGIFFFSFFCFCNVNVLHSLLCDVFALFHLAFCNECATKSEIIPFCFSFFFIFFLVFVLFATPNLMHTK